jgi:high-affinity nickel permease
VLGLDDQIATLGAGQTFLIVAAVAALLGLRHATDPDHLTAVSTLVASGSDRGPRRAGALGFSWGLGHATSLFAFGLPIVVARSYLPEAVREAAEFGIGLLIVALAIRLLVRWRRGRLAPDGAHHHHGRARSPLQAYGIGLLHGVGGSAGVGILLLAAIPDHVEGAVALAIFALFTAISMALASTAFGYGISRGPVLRRFMAVAPALGVASLAFGVWYALGAVNAVPYVF